MSGTSSPVALSLRADGRGKMFLSFPLNEFFLREELINKIITKFKLPTRDKLLNYGETGIEYFIDSPKYLAICTFATELLHNLEKAESLL